MELEFKEDFEQAVERLEACWECEVIDRACVQVTYKKDDNISVYDTIIGCLHNELDEKHKSLREKWMDVEYQVERAIKIIEQTTYLGEAFPMCWPNLGPDLWGTLYGTDLEFGEDTSWAKHFVEDWNKFIEEAGDFKPDFTNQYWQTIEQMMRLSLKKGKGKFITGLPDFHPGGDLLASLRDPQKLCIDLIEKPDTIKYINERLTAFYPQVYGRVYKIVEEYGQGATTWLPAYHQGKFYVPCCDLSALISQNMFEDIFLPGIRQEIDFLDRSIYHVDGPNALRHLDTILKIPNLDGVEWVYGAGNGPATKWIDVYRRIQEAGKCNHVIVETPQDVEQILNELSPEGLLFTFFAPLPREEAEKVLEIVNKKK
jgi:hypothetical protein